MKKGGMYMKNNQEYRRTAYELTKDKIWNILIATGSFTDSEGKSLKL